MKTKICGKCNINQIIENFSFKSKKDNKRQNICKNCNKIYSDNHYKKNKIGYLYKSKINNKFYKIRNKEYLVSLIKGKPCHDCGGIYPHYVMDFDHLPSFSKIKNVSTMGNSSASISSLQEEILKCDLVCANCHRIRTWSRTHTE